MKGSRFSEEQIIGILREHEAGATTAEVCRKHGARHLRRSSLILADLQLVSTSHPAGASRVATVSLCLMPSPIPRRNHWVLLSLTSPVMAAFPESQAGRLPHRPFRGLLGVQSLRPASSQSH